VLSSAPFISSAFEDSMKSLVVFSLNSTIKVEKPEISPVPSVIELPMVNINGLLAQNLKLPFLQNIE